MRSLPLDDPGTPPLSGPTALLWWLARRQWGILLTAVGLGMLQFAAQAFTPFVVGRAIDDGLDSGFGPDLWRACGTLLALGAVIITASAIGHRYDVNNWLRAAFTSSQLVGAHRRPVGPHHHQGAADGRGRVGRRQRRAAHR